MKHLILGNGNLGKDLFLEINARRLGEPRLLSRSRRLDVTNCAQLENAFREFNPTHVWYCVGGGSVAESKPGTSTYEGSITLNAKVPFAIANMIPEKTKLILFSTDYVADETRPKNPDFFAPFLRSKYAQNKLMMEQSIFRLNRPDTCIVRVGSLYGVHKTQNTFPGKILHNYAFNDQIIKLPSNIVVPTPTRWLAAMLLNHLEEIFSDFSPVIHHCAPEGGVSVKDWAKFVLKGFRDDSAFHWGRDFFDTERPLFSGLGTSFGDRKDFWHDLWMNYFKSEWFLKDVPRTALEKP